MEARRGSLALLLLLSLCLANVISLAEAGSSIGINYGTVASNLPTPEAAVALILKTTVRKVKIYDTDPEVLKAFANSGIQVVVGVPNDQIEFLSRGVHGYAQEWVERHIQAFLPATDIRIIAVGNEVLTSNDTTDSMRTLLLPAMANIHTALVNLKLDFTVKVSTPHSLEILAPSFPPSVTVFKPYLARLLAPLATFLVHTGSSFMVNAYPYFAYRDGQRTEQDRLYALGQGPNEGETDNRTGIHYSNLFSAQVDAVYYALANIGIVNLAVVVSESGWPWAGDANEVGVDVVNAQSYVYNLVKRLQSNVSTPARPDAGLDVYLFSLFNENLKPGPGSERHFGLFYPDSTPVYDSGILGPDIPLPRGPQAAPSPQESSSPPPPTAPASPAPEAPAPEAPAPEASYPPPPAPVHAPPPPSPVVYNPPPPEAFSPPPPAPPVVYNPPPAPVVYNPPPAPVVYSPPPVVYSPPPVVYSPPPSPVAPVYPPPAVNPPTGPSPGPGSTWCVAKPGAAAGDLVNALSYACGEPGVDCTPIQQGGPCFLPDLLASHASFAMNQYYQVNGRNTWNCFFNGNAVITITNPSTGTCVFTTG